MWCGGFRDPGGIEPLVSAVVDEQFIGVGPVSGNINDEWLNLVPVDVSLEGENYPDHVTFKKCFNPHSREGSDLG